LQKSLPCFAKGTRWASHPQSLSCIGFAKAFRVLVIPGRICTCDSKVRVGSVGADRPPPGRQCRVTVVFPAQSHFPLRRVADLDLCSGPRRARKTAKRLPHEYISPRFFFCWLADSWGRMFDPFRRLRLAHGLGCLSREAVPTMPGWGSLSHTWNLPGRRAR
jgi:hypothetical protein